MQEVIKRFIDCNVPTQVCNLKCPYCYVGQVDGFSGRIKPIEHTPAEVRAALSRKRMGGIIFINFCGTGETLLGEDILPIIQEVLKEGHFVQIVTNGTINKRFEEISEWDRELLERLLIKFSYHYTELKRLEKLNDFFSNVITSRNAGCSVSVEITSGDDMVPYIDEMKQICVEKLGALPHVTVARNNASPTNKLLTNYSEEEYVSAWSSFHSDLFDLKMKLYGERREEYCFGGEWTFYLYLSNGDLKQCYNGEVIDNIFEDVTKPIHLKPIGRGCPEPYCFNGHAWMTLGCIPGRSIPSYADIRNRKTSDGHEWLTERAKNFFSHKLEENNITYANVDSNSKVLLLGDSISKGYREIVRDMLEDRVEVYYPDGITTFTTGLLRYMHEIAEKLFIGSNIDVVYFNAGLWDVLRIDGDEPLVSREEYQKNLQRIIGRIRFLFPNAQIVFATTTPVLEEFAKYEFLRLNEDIEEYNNIARCIMEQNHVYIHDLNKVVNENINDDYIDFTHFTNKGYRLIAQEVASCISSILNDSHKKADADMVAVVDQKIRKDYGLLSKKRVVVYGGGDYGEKVISELKKREIMPILICDKSKAKQKQLIHGLSVVSPERYRNEICIREEDLLIIAVKNLHIVRNIIQEFSDIEGLDICTYKIFSDILSTS